MSFEDKAKVVVKLGQLNKLDDLKIIVENLEVKELQEICENRIKQNDINTFFHYLMKGFTDSEESMAKRFLVVDYILKCCNRDELNIQSTLDLVTRICVDLETSFKNEHIVQLIESCLDSIRLQGSQTVYWKDLLPQLINLIMKVPLLDVNGISMSGLEYRSAIIKNLTLFKWRLEILTPLASMFKDIDMTKGEREQIMTKLGENLFHSEPTELPGLALQMFGLCNTPLLIVSPVLYFQKYFNKNYYTKEYENLDSNTTHHDSIDLHPAQELQQIQETVLYHLSNSTEFRMNEKDVVAVFRNLANTPHYLLTPFMISTLLSLSKVNRQPDVVRLSSSPILPFLRKVIQNNEHEKEMSRNSLWCRQTFNRNTVAIDNVIEILIDQSITGMEVVTPGVVGLAFTLLKAKKQPELNLLGINFLQKFLKKRYIFGQGILRQLADLLFANPDWPQYAECLNTLSLTNTLTISECVATVQSILDFLLLIPGPSAMRIISFIYPLIKISFTIRDSLIEVLTKAMSQTDSQMRRFGVYGFCLLLKNLRNNNSRRAAGGSVSSSNLSFTQGNISGFSLMSQSTLGNRDNPQRHFDMLALEVIGILRKCFNETSETKEILYEGLTRAIEFNYKLTSHVLIFIDWHFRSYFEVVGGAALEVKFERIVNDTNGELDVWDDIGKLVSFVGTCVMICEEHHIMHDNRVVIELLGIILEKCDSITVESLNLQNDKRSREVGRQYLHLLEGIMAYATMTSTAKNATMRRFYAIYKHHEKVSAEMKTLFTEKRAAKKGRAATAKGTATSTPNCTETEDLQFTVSGTMKDPEEHVFKPENIWETQTMQKLLNMVFGTEAANHLDELKEDAGFKAYLLKVVTAHVESYRHLPDYRHVKHSRRMVSFLCDVTRVMFRAVKEIFDDTDTAEGNDKATLAMSMCLDCFRQCLLTCDIVYKRKLEEFFQHLGDAAANGSVFHEQVLAVIKDIHKLVERSLDEEVAAMIGGDFKKIQQNLLHCLEILYNYLPPEHSECAAVSSWLYNFCLNYVIDGRHLDQIFKLLFTQRLKYYDGDFFTSVALQMSRIFGVFKDVDVDSQAKFELKSITELSAETALLHLCGVLKKDVEDVECTLLKAKSMASKIKFLGDRGTDDDHIQALKTMERAICAHLIHVANALLHLTNCQVPVGTTSDTLIKQLTLFYICLNNVCKHLIARHNVIPVVYSHIQFDKLIQISGKPLAGRVYDMITYIDQNMLSTEDTNQTATATKKKKVNAPEQKKKLLRETRSLPRLIRWLEMLHKYVLLLGKKTSRDISAYLHIGVVRDFRIKSSNLLMDEENDSNLEENANDESDAESLETMSSGFQDVSGTATEKIMKHASKLRTTKKKTSKPSAANPKRAPAKRTRTPAAIVVPDVTGILSTINDNAGPKPKKARRSAKST